MENYLHLLEQTLDTRKSKFKLLLTSFIVALIITFILSGGSIPFVYVIFALFLFPTGLLIPFETLFGLIMGQVVYNNLLAKIQIPISIIPWLIYIIIIAYIIGTPNVYKARILYFIFIFLLFINIIGCSIIFSKETF